MRCVVATETKSRASSPARCRKRGGGQRDLDHPDEQQAVDAALRMGQPGDLVLVFADALVRSWKQIIKFQPQGEAPRPDARMEPPTLEPALDETDFAAMQGVVRDERGLHFEREAGD